jgi:hypothetical protein
MSGRPFACWYEKDRLSRYECLMPFSWRQPYGSRTSSSWTTSSVQMPDFVRVPSKKGSRSLIQKFPNSFLQYPAFAARTLTASREALAT